MEAPGDDEACILRAKAWCVAGPAINRKRLHLTHPTLLAADIDADAIEASRIDEKPLWEDVLSDQFLDEVGWDE